MDKLEKNQLKNILSEKEYNEFTSGEIDDIIGNLKHEGYEDKNNKLKNLLLEDEKNNWTLKDFSKKIK